MYNLEIFTCNTTCGNPSGAPPPIRKHLNVRNIIRIINGGEKHNLLSHGDLALIA